MNKFIKSLVPKQLNYNTSHVHNDSKIFYNTLFLINFTSLLIALAFLLAGLYLIVTLLDTQPANVDTKIAKIGTKLLLMVALFYLAIPNIINLIMKKYVKKT